jgi:hypothetical protein
MRRLAVPLLFIAAAFGQSAMAQAGCQRNWLGLVCSGQRYVEISEDVQLTRDDIHCAARGRLACIVGVSRGTNCEGVWLGSVCDGQKFIDTFKENPFRWQNYVCGFNSAKNVGGCIVPAHSADSPTPPQQIPAPPVAEANARHVFVEPWETLVRNTMSVTAGKAVQYNFTLPAGARVLAQFQVQGGLNDKIQVFLLDYSNFQLYSAHQHFQFYQGSSGTVRGVGKIEFRVPQAGVYYLILDNGKAWLMPRNVTLHVDAILPQSTPASEQIRSSLEQQYSLLKRVFIFPDFQTSVRHCGVVNAFSNPNITLCAELLEHMAETGMGAAIGFAYLHELGHTLMRQWGLPLWDNEDAADEFATAFLLLGKQQTLALQAAQYWASENVNTKDAVAKIYLDDRHSLSPQRARNIIRWINNRNEIVPRWERVFIPNMQTQFLEAALRDATFANKDLVRSELSHRTR